MEFLFDIPYIGNFIIPTDELHHFQRGRAQPPTRLARVSLEAAFFSAFVGQRQGVPPMQVTAMPLAERYVSATTL